MKRKTLYRILAVLVTATMLFSACTKETADVKLDPALATTQSLKITASSATVVGYVIAEGDGYNEKGICYNTAAAPTVDNSKVAYTGQTKTATFNVTLSGLNYATKYYARAYATSASGTIYGDEQMFTTLPVLPTLTTAVVSAITGTTASAGGAVTNNGGAEITARGVCYSLTLNPTVANSKTSDGTGSGAFVSALSKLNGLTTYHVRAYATNSVGTAYGNDVLFTTLVSIRNWNIPGDYVAASYPGSTFADWSPDKSPQVKSLESAPDKLEGYVYMANATNNWKFASQPNWNGPNYGDDDNSGKLDPNAANNINSPAGYYKINADAAAMTYTTVATVWGVIGDASPQGWNDETQLTYNPTLAVWTGGMHLTAAAIKFRANHDWGLNYGSDNADGKLGAGAANIPVSLESDYSITLDLSHPNTYTYNVNRWGVIGDATPDGWNSDQNMTWDATNKVFKITVDLTVGTFKFRANDAWDLDYGGDINALTKGGANIAVATAGNYTITFNPWTLKATVTKN